MLSCPLLWLRQSSRQLLCPAARFVSSSSITFHYVLALPGARALKFGSLPTPQSTQITTNFRAHPPHLGFCTPFRFIPSSFSQQAAVHPLPLLCEPARSSRLRAVMIYASPRKAHRSHKCTPALVRKAASHWAGAHAASSLIVRIALLRPGSLLTPVLPLAASLRETLRSSLKARIYLIPKQNPKLKCCSNSFAVSRS